MPRVKLELEDTGGYIPLKCGYYYLYILGLFLSTEMLDGGYDFFYEWMNDPSLDGTGGNIMSLDKIGNNVVMYPLFDEDLYDSDPIKYSLTIDLKELISLAEKLKELQKLKPKPPFIIITEENGKYTIEASNE